MALAGVAVDVIFDSVSVATTYKHKLAEVGVIFCSMSEAVLEHPELVKKYLGTVVPTDALSMKTFIPQQWLNQVMGGAPTQPGCRICSTKMVAPLSGD